MGLLGILLALGLLIWLAYRGWSVLLLAPAAALLAAAVSREPLLAHWTQTFMGSAAQFLAQFFPLFLLGALFGKLMDDSGSVHAIARFMTERLGNAPRGAGGRARRCRWSPMAASACSSPSSSWCRWRRCMFQAADIPRRLMPAAVALGTLTFTMSALPGTPAIQNAIPMPFFGTTPFAAPGLGIIASAIMLGFGLWWLCRAEAAARTAGEGFGPARRHRRRPRRRRSDHPRAGDRRPRIRPRRNPPRPPHRDHAADRRGCAAARSSSSSSILRWRCSSCRGSTCLSGRRALGWNLAVSASPASGRWRWRLRRRS